MSYEYKDYFKRLHINETRKIGTDLNDKFKALDELNEVYAQAAEYKEYRADTEKLYNALKAKGEREIQKYKSKADEYEAKAKAWDRVYEAFEKAENEHEFSNGVCTIMNEYESGGYDAKK